MNLGTKNYVKLSRSLQIFESDSEFETQNIKISSPIPRPSRVLDRETRPFESETRDSGISAIDLLIKF